MQIDRTLATARRDQIEREAGAAFDRRREDFAGRAREIYLLDKDKYTVPPKVRATHILIRTEKRGKDEALKLATEIRAKAIAPKAPISPRWHWSSRRMLSVKTNKGDLGWFDAKQVDRAFSKAAFAMQKPGEISEPVLSSSGYHIIRLDGRKPAELRSFDAVRNQIMAELKRDYVKQAKIAALDGVFRDPTLELNQPAIDGLATRIDPEALTQGRGGDLQIRTGRHHGFCFRGGGDRIERRTDRGRDRRRRRPRLQCRGRRRALRRERASPYRSPVSTGADRRRVAGSGDRRATSPS